MNVITDITLTEGVAVVSFESAPSSIGFISNLFSNVAEAEINIDMISQTAPKGSVNTISFTIGDNDVTGLLAVIARLKQKEKTIMPFVSPGNVKISLYGEEMPKYAGVAADVYNRLAQESIDTILITTSDVDISLVVSHSNADKAYECLKKAYNI